MPILFECDCGKRLKAREEIAGRKTRCPQCGRMNTIPRPSPAAEPTVVDEPTTAFVLVLDDDLAGPIRFAVGDDENEPGPDIETDAAEPPGIKLKIDLANEPSLATDRAPPSIVLPKLSPEEEDEPGVIEPAPLEQPSVGVLPEIAPEPAPHRRASRLNATEPATLREPWYIGWVTTLARGVIVAALVLSLVAPAFLLAGGLTALARTGNPRTLADWRLGEIPLAALILGAWAVCAALALLWAGPVLMLVDQSRRFRALVTRLEELARRQSTSTLNEAMETHSEQYQ